MSIRGTVCACKFFRSVALSLTAIACLLPASAAMAQATLSASTLAFGNVAAGTTSAPKSVTLKNTGTASFTINTISLSGSSDYGFASPPPSTACTAGQQLASTKTCTISVTLTPTALVAEAASSLTVTTTSITTLSPVTLTGKGIAPVTISPASFTYANLALGNTVSKSFTLKNFETKTLNITSLSGLSGDFSLDTADTTCPMAGGTVNGQVPAGASCVIAINFDPSTKVTESETIGVNDDAWQSPQTFVVKGTGILPVTLSPASLIFAAQMVGTTSASKTVTVTNLQPIPLNNIAVSIAGASPNDFSYQSTCPVSPASLPAAASCSVQVSFKPTTSGTRSATLSISDDAATSPQTATLTGSGTAPVTIAPASLTFSANVGATSKYQILTIANKDTVNPLTISNVQVSGDFSLTGILQSGTYSCGTSSYTSFPYTISAGGACQIEVSFSPTVGGMRGGQVQIYDGAPTSPQVVNLTGSATNPLTISPASLSFSAQKQGTTSPAKLITLTNHETQPETFTLNPTSTTTAGNDFSASSNCSTGVIAANSSCLLYATFDPSATGTITGKLTIPNSASSGSTPAGSWSFSAALTGSGTATNPGPAVTSVFPGAANAGATIPVKITGNGWTNFGPKSVITFVDTASSSYPAGITISQAPITAYSFSSGVLTLTANNSFAAGTAVTFVVSSSTSKLYPLNGQSFSVLATGLSGTHFAITESTVTGSGSATATATTQIAVSPNEIDATLVIASSSVVGARNITVNTLLSSGKTESAKLASAFVILNSSQAYAITGVAPNTGAQGTLSMNVSLTGTGTGWLQGTTYANFGQGITINSLEIIDSTDAVANISISNTTFTGPRQIMMATGGEIDVTSPAAPFYVTPNDAALLSINPNSSGQTAIVPVTLTASGTHFLQGATTVSLTGGSGVTVGAVTVTSPTTATASVTVASNAAPGLYNVSVATGGETASLANAFTVISTAPYLSSVAPNSAVQGTANLDVVITGVNTLFTQANAIAVNFNPGGNIVVNKVTVNSDTQVTININVNTVASPGGISGNLILNPGTGQVLFPFGFTIMPSSASIVSVSPSSVPQGGQVTLDVTGSGTVWDQNTTTAAFYWLPYPYPQVNMVTINGATSAQLAITVPANTPPGNYAFYLQTGGQTVSSSITVYANTPSLTMNPANGLRPTGSNINQFTVNFIGQFTHFGSNTQAVIAGEGATLTNFQVTGQTSATATLTIIAGVNGTPTALGPRLVTLTTGGEIVTTYFNVTTIPVRIVSVSPWHGPQSTTIPVALVGLNTHWVQGTTQVLAGLQTQVSNIVVADATHLTFDLTTSFIDNNNTLPTPAGWQSVYINTPTGATTEQVITGFLVDAPQMPSIVSACLTGYLPQQCVSSAQQGASGMTVEITGSLTKWDSTSLLTLGSGITVVQLTVNGPTSATAVISVSPTAPVGGNGIFMYTADTQTTDSGGGFSVTQGASEITGVVPDSQMCSANVATYAAACGVSNGAGTPFVISQMQTATLDVTGQGTHWLQGETQVSFGPGVAIDSLSVTDSTDLTVQITVLSTSPIGFVPLTTSTDGEVTTLQQAIDIENSYPTMLASTPFSSQQGNTFTMLVMGRSANWVQGETNAAVRGSYQRGHYGEFGHCARLQRPVAERDRKSMGVRGWKSGHRLRPALPYRHHRLLAGRQPNQFHRLATLRHNRNHLRHAGRAVNRLGFAFGRIAGLDRASDHHRQLHKLYQWRNSGQLSAIQSPVGHDYRPSTPRMYKRT